MNTTSYPRQGHTGAARVLPLLGWLRGYRRETLRRDLVAGLTVAVMLVPQSMAYAALAGMPPVTGLYAALVPLVAYALLGTSGSLAVGPVAITALMTSAALAPLAGGEPARYAALAGLLALLVGGIHIVMGLARLGTLVQFISHPVLIGFTSAAALVIAASQLKELLGVQAGRAQTFWQIVGSLWTSAGTAHPLTIAVALGSVAGLLLLRRFAPRLPGPLLVVTAATAISAVLAFGDRGVRILTDVPAGLPAPALPALRAADAVALLPAAVAIALVAYLEGIAVAKALAARSRQPVDPGRELLALGAANVSAGLFQAFPVAGGFSRSAVNFAAGARTPVATLFTAAVVALTAALLTPAFHYLPHAVLAAIVVVAVLGLVDLRGARQAWRTRRVDGMVVALTFASTLLLGIEPGLAAGVGASLAVFLWRSARPHTAELGRTPGAGGSRDLRRYPELASGPGVVVWRMGGPLFFANAQRVTDELLALAGTREGLTTVVLDASAISDVDLDGLHALEHLHEVLAGRDVRLRLATVGGPVRDLLRRSATLRELDTAGRIPYVPAALAAAGR